MLSPSHPVHLVLGLVVWSIWFVVLYGGLSVACAVAPPPVAMGPLTWVNAVLGAITLGVTVLLLYLARSCWRTVPVVEEEGNPSRFVTQVAAGVHLVAAAATLAVGLPLLVLPPCP